MPEPPKSSASSRRTFDVCARARTSPRRNPKGVGNCNQGRQSHILDATLDAAHVNCPKAGLLGQFFLGEVPERAQTSNVRGDEALDLDGSGKLHLPPELARGLFLKQTL